MTCFVYSASVAGESYCRNGSTQCTICCGWPFQHLVQGMFQRLPQIKISRVPAQNLPTSLMKQLHHTIRTSWWWRWGKIPLRWSRMAQMTHVYLWQLNCFHCFHFLMFMSHWNYTHAVHACKISCVPYHYRTWENEPLNCQGIWYQQSCAQICWHVHHRW